MQGVRGLLLIIGLLFLFFPTLSTWLFQSDASWFRPHLFAAGLILVSYLTQLEKPSDEL
ncbi:MAG: hypothetical protein O2851_03860 [Proteobacteria bacterium]|nr:hypothetical protein [Pseudomonadota bacterium]MDA0953053.1 hypothetical protein [Pseudomonadota bacterium]